MIGTVENSKNDRRWIEMSRLYTFISHKKIVNNILTKARCNNLRMAIIASAWRIIRDIHQKLEKTTTISGKTLEILRQLQADALRCLLSYDGYAQIE